MNRRSFLGALLSSPLLPAAALARAIPIAGTDAATEDSHAITKYNQPDSYAAGADEGSGPTNCCGEADAYWADEYETGPDGYIAIVTDPRNDDQFRDGKGHPRHHVPIGTRVEVPARKVITFPPQEPNNTGHGWVWLSAYEDEVTGKVTGYNVICYLAPAGL